MTQNEEEFTQLVRTYKSTVYTVCYMFSSDDDEVNDLFQETLINLWKGFGHFRGESSPRTWVYRVALNTCLSYGRKKKREVDKVPLNMDISLYDDDDTDTRQIQQLHERIGRLGLFDRAIVMLWLEGMSYEEIGQTVGLTPKNVSVKLVRIKEQLKKG